MIDAAMCGIVSNSKDKTKKDGNCDGNCAICSSADVCQSALVLSE